MTARGWLIMSNTWVGLGVSDEGCNGEGGVSLVGPIRLQPCSVHQGSILH